MDHSVCKQVTPACPVGATTYGYFPNLGANIFFTIAFGIIALLQVGFGLKYRTWSWLGFIFLGSGMETAGYVGRVLMNSNPWSQPAYRLQIIMLILAPSFASACVNLTLKHIVLVFGAKQSRLRPAWYTWLFISLDLVSIVTQAIGGALAASAASTDRTNVPLLNAGNDVILVGIAMQVAQLIAFASVTLEYIHRTRKLPKGSLSIGARNRLADPRFKLFTWTTGIAFTGILIRCIYRIPEMAGGWGGPIQRDEPSFLVLDGAMVLISMIALTVGHPGWAFKQLCKLPKSGSTAQTSVRIDTEKEAVTREGEEFVHTLHTQSRTE